MAAGLVSESEGLLVSGVVDGLSAATRAVLGLGFLSVPAALPGFGPVAQAKGLGSYGPGNHFE